MSHTSHPFGGAFVLPCPDISSLVTRRGTEDRRINFAHTNNSSFEFSNFCEISPLESAGVGGQPTSPDVIFREFHNKIRFQHPLKTILSCITSRSAWADGSGSGPLTVNSGPCCGDPSSDNSRAVSNPRCMLLGGTRAIVLQGLR